MSREYLVHGVTLALAWFAVVNGIVSAVVAVAARRLVTDDRPRTAGWWFAVRCLPAALSFAFVAAVFVPSYVRFEPHETIEGFDLTVTLFAAAAVVLLFASAARGARAWQRASRQASVWMRSARPLDRRVESVPTYTIGAAPAPLMALVGVTSPRVFVSQRLVDALSGEELATTLAHEASHARSRDNLKRLLMRLLPDVLGGTAAAIAIEQRWASAAEHAADRAATGGDASARCTLASALVKVARMVPATPSTHDPICTLVGGGDLASRVESLLSDRPAGAASRRLRWPGAAALVAAALVYAPALRGVHAITEILVNSLP